MKTLGSQFPLIGRKSVARLKPPFCSDSKSNSPLGRNLLDPDDVDMAASKPMRGKLWACSLVSCLCLAIGTLAAQAEIKKVSPNNSGFTIMPINADGPTSPQPIDPILPAFAPDSAAAAVPEPSTIAMMFLGSGCLGALLAFRRRRRT